MTSWIDERVASAYRLYRACPNMHGLFRLFMLGYWGRRDIKSDVVNDN